MFETVRKYDIKFVCFEMFLRCKLLEVYYSVEKFFVRLVRIIRVISSCLVPILRRKRGLYFDTSSSETNCSNTYYSCVKKQFTFCVCLNHSWFSKPFFLEMLCEADIYWPATARRRTKYLSDSTPCSAIRAVFEQQAS